MKYRLGRIFSTCNCTHQSLPESKNLTLFKFVHRLLLAKSSFLNFFKKISETNNYCKLTGAGLTGQIYFVDFLLHPCGVNRKVILRHREISLAELTLLGQTFEV